MQKVLVELIRFYIPATTIKVCCLVCEKLTTNCHQFCGIACFEKFNTHLVSEQRLTVSSVLEGELFWCSMCENEIPWTKLDEAHVLNMKTHSLLEEKESNNLYCSDMCVLDAKDSYREYCNEKLMSN